MVDQYPSVILADDHPLMLAGLRSLLEPSFDVVAMVTDGEALLEAAVRMQPALVVTDISMPVIDGIEVTRRLRVAVPATRVVILSLHSDPSWVRAAFDAGAWGYVTKSAAAEEVDGAIREVMEGRFYVSPHVTRALFSTPTETAQHRPPAPQGVEEALTPREEEVMRWVGLGLSNKEIGSRLGVSVTTVRSHMKSIYSKLGHDTRVELALYAAHVTGAAD